MASSKTSSKTSSPAPSPAPSSASFLRIGIVGAASIARKNIRAIQHLSNGKSCILAAIASRSEEKLSAYVKEHVNNPNSVKQYTGPNAYDELIASKDIDALYMPLPTTLHLEYVTKALKAGKHVLVEKPVSTTEEEYKEMICAAKEANKFLMDGTMFVHNPRTNDVISHIHSDDKNSDQVLRVESAFTFPGDDSFFNTNIRVKKGGDLHGCIGDLGWYCIRIAQLAFQSPPVSAQVTHFELNEDSVPIDATCMVTFQDNKEQGATRKIAKILTFHCSFLHPLNQYATIYGTKTSIHLDDFIITKEDQGNDNVDLDFLEKFQTLTFADQYSVHNEKVKKCTKNDKIPQEAMMWSNFVKYCHGLDKNDEKVVREGQDLQTISFENQRIVNALIDSVRSGGKKIHIKQGSISSSTQCNYKHNR